jgi:hypothetical protein
VDGVQKMSNFENLENDIAGDWLVYSKENTGRRRKRKRKKSKSPKSLHCTYKEFYRKIHEVFYCFDSYE